MTVVPVTFSYALICIVTTMVISTQQISFITTTLVRSHQIGACIFTSSVVIITLIDIATFCRFIFTCPTVFYLTGIRTAIERIDIGIITLFTA